MVKCESCDGKGYTQTEKKGARCKMSICIEEISQDDLCALAMNVHCEGLREDSNNCPFWKRAGET